MKTDNSCLQFILFLLLFLQTGLSQADNDARLFFAAQAGQYDSVHYLIEQGANVNYANLSRETPMHAAAAKGHLDIIRLLRANGASYNRRTSGNWMPLHHAVRFGHVVTAKYLLGLGTPLYVRTRDGKTVFDIAEATRDREMLYFLESWRLGRR